MSLAVVEQSSESGTVQYIIPVDSHDQAVAVAKRILQKRDGYEPTEDEVNAFLAGEELSSDDSYFFLVLMSLSKPGDIEDLIEAELEE